MKALKVLADCKECYWDLKDALESNDQQQIRIKWITCLTFLRMVGHVLEKVDQSQSEKSDIFIQLFKEKKGDDIFKKFMESERNMALKEYDILIDPDEYDMKTEQVMLFQDGKRKLFQSGAYHIDQGEKNSKYFASKRSKTDNEKDLDSWIKKSIEWWEDYINELQNRLNAT